MNIEFSQPTIAHAHLFSVIAHPSVAPHLAPQSVTALLEALDATARLLSAHPSLSDDRTISALCADAVIALVAAAIRARAAGALDAALTAGTALIAAPHLLASAPASISRLAEALEHARRMSACWALCERSPDRGAWSRDDVAAAVVAHAHWRRLFESARAVDEAIVAPILASGGGGGGSVELDGRWLVAVLALLSSGSGGGIGNGSGGGVGESVAVIEADAQLIAAFPAIADDSARRDKLIDILRAIGGGGGGGGMNASNSNTGGPSDANGRDSAQVALSPSKSRASASASSAILSSPPPLASSSSSLRSPNASRRLSGGGVGGGSRVASSAASPASPASSSASSASPASSAFDHLRWTEIKARLRQNGGGRDRSVDDLIEQIESRM